MLAAAGYRTTCAVGARGVGDLDPAVDDRSRGEVIHDVELRSRIVACGDRDVEEPQPDAAGGRLSGTGWGRGGRARGRGDG